MSGEIFVDSSALLALYLEDDLFHNRAVKFWRKTWQKAKKENIGFFINNFIFGEVVTWLCQRKGKKIAVNFGNFLIENQVSFPIKQVLPQDQEKAWQLFQKLSGKLSFTDCACFAMMRRLKVKKAFTFDKHFLAAGFKIFP